MLELRKHISRRYVNAGDRLGRDDNSPHWSWRFSNGVEDSLVKELGVSKEKRRIATKQDQAWNTTRTGIACNVVVAANAINSPEHREVRAPAVPQKLDHRNDYGDPDAGNYSEHGNADKTNHREPKFPLLNA